MTQELLSLAVLELTDEVLDEVVGGSFVTLEPDEALDVFEVAHKMGFECGLPGQFVVRGWKRNSAAELFKIILQLAVGIEES